MTVTSCFDGNKFLRFFNFGNKPAKEVATEAPAEAAVEATSPVVDAPGPNALYSNSYDGYTNVRESASSKAAVLGELRNGNDYVTMIGEEGNWYEVEYYDQIGYVHKDYVSHTPSKPVTVDVDAKWLEGVWTCMGLTYYVVFSNGKFALEQQYSTIGYGRWHLEGNEIVFTLKHVTDFAREWELPYKRGDVERYVINKGERKVGEMERYNTPTELEEGEDGITKSYFKSLKKAANQYVK